MAMEYMPELQTLALVTTKERISILNYLNSNRTKLYSSTISENISNIPKGSIVRNLKKLCDLDFVQTDGQGLYWITDLGIHVFGELNMIATRFGKPVRELVELERKYQTKRKSILEKK